MPRHFTLLQLAVLVSTGKLEWQHRDIDRETHRILHCLYFHFDDVLCDTLGAPTLSRVRIHVDEFEALDALDRLKIPANNLVNWLNPAETSNPNNSYARILIQVEREFYVDRSKDKPAPKQPEVKERVHDLMKGSKLPYSDQLASSIATMARPINLPKHAGRR